MKILNIPLQSLSEINPAIVLLLLPFFYLIGMIFDDIAFRPLNASRKRIQNNVFKGEVLKDELLAYASEGLYDAYEMRVRRVRIIGAGIFNWPLLCFAILLHMEGSYWYYQLIIISLAILLSAISLIIWKNLYKRAYKFRKNAGEILLEYSSELKREQKDEEVKKRMKLGQNTPYHIEKKSFSVYLGV